MMKRLLPGYLFFFLLIFLCAVMPAKAQDSTKTTASEKPIEKKAEPVKAATVSTATNTATPTSKPVIHNRKAQSTVPQTPVNNDSANIKNQIDPTQLNAKSLSGQYQYLLTKTYHYQQPLITAFWKSVSDSIKQIRSQAKGMQASVNHTVDSLKANVRAKEQTLTEAIAKNDSISLLGIDMSKGTYSLVLFGIIVCLAIALTIVLGTTAKHKYEAKHRTELYEEIEEDYRNFKIKANEKEKKLARELQTERNKLDELLGRG
jgi:hypothetical protein